jgi:hypothetical protein
LISPPRLDLPEEGVGRSAASWGIQRVRSYVHVVQSTSSALRAFRAEPAFSMARPNRHGLGGHAVRRRLKHVWVCFRTHGPPAGYAALIRTRSVKRKKRKRKSECAKIGRFRNPSHAGSASCNTTAQALQSVLTAKNEKSEVRRDHEPAALAPASTLSACLWT